MSDYPKIITMIEPKMMAFYLETALASAKRTMAPTGPGQRWPEEAKRQAWAEIEKLQRTINNIKNLPTPLEDEINKKKGA